jgi:hypothetical protein
VKYVGAEGAGDLASREGFKKWFFLLKKKFSMFLGHTACSNFFPKKIES